MRSLTGAYYWHIKLFERGPNGTLALQLPKVSGFLSLNEFRLPASFQGGGGAALPNVYVSLSAH